MKNSASSTGACLSVRARAIRAVPAIHAVPAVAPLALVLALAAAFPALSQTQPSTLRETVVTATRVEQPVSDLLADVSIVDRETIERSGAVGVVDVLARLPGIEISRSGGLGNTSGVFIRGAESRFTAVYLDGVRLDTQTTGGASWEAIPLSQIDRIEVLRGPAAAVYGSDAIGGVIQLFTRKGEAGGIAPYVGVGIGSHNMRRIEAGVSGTAGAFDYSLGVAREKSDGYNVRLDRGQNPDRDDYRTSSGNARLGFQINAQHRVEATLLANNVDSGYDDVFVPSAPADDRSRHQLRTAGLNWTAQWTDVWRTKVSLTDSSDKYATDPNFYRTETSLRGLLFQNEFRFGPHLVTAALERREDELKNAPGVGPFAAPGLARDRSQNGLALGYAFTQGPHAVQLNVRRDDDSEFGNHNTGSAAYGFSITPAWRVTASAGTAFRAPTLYQRFSQYGIAGLEPEESRNVELGLRFAQGATSASAVVYRNRVRNLIGFDSNSTACASAFPGCYGNTGRAVYEGLTLAGSHRLGDVTLRGSLDFQDPRNADTDKVLVQRARRHGVVGADLRVGIWTLGAEVQASGVRYANATNTQRLHGYGLINLVASAPLTPELTLVARLDNAADREYQLVRNYATPGRTAYLGLKWAPKL